MAGQCELSFVWEKSALTRSVLELVLEVGEGEQLHERHSSLEGLRQAMGNCTVVAVRDEGELRYDIRKDSGTDERIEWEEDMADSNVVDIDDAVDDERDCEVVDYNDLRERNVDMGPLAVLAGQQAQHVPHSWHRDTFPLEDEYASSDHRQLVAQDHQTGVANEHNTRSSVISDELKS